VGLELLLVRWLLLLLGVERNSEWLLLLLFLDGLELRVG
jgi:hypothetical protein